MTLEQYMARRRWWEILMITGFVVVMFLTSLGVVLVDRERIGLGSGLTVPVILEGTSHVAILLVFPLLLWFDHHFTLGGDRWLRNLFAHALFSVAFSVAHVALMYWMRVALFRAVLADTYHWDDWLGEFAYEYLKDVRTYMGILVMVYLYRFVLRRLQGEAGFLAEEDEPSAPTSDRFLVKKLGREFLVRVDDIDWIESCGNYVNLHVGGRVYPLRETMTRIDERLVPMGFQRVHRSAIVNLDRVAEIKAFDSGDGEARLRNDVSVPVSRRFRQALRERLA